MEINIRNIGQIGSSCNISIHGLTVIAGVNNSGKSTLNRTVYSALSSLYQYKAMINNSKKSSIMDIFEDTVNEIDFDPQEYFDFKDSFKEEIDELTKNDVPFEMFYQTLVQKIKDTGFEYVDDESNDIKNKLSHFLNTDDETILTSNASNNFASEFYGQITNVNNPDLDSTIELTIKGKTTTFHIKSDRILSIENPSELRAQPMFLDESMNVSGMTPRYYRVRSRFSQNHIQKFFDSLSRPEKLYNTNEHSGEEFLNLNNLYVNHKLSTIFEKLESVIPANLTVSGLDRKIKRELGNDSAINLNNISSGLKTFIYIKRLLQNETLSENGTLILDEPEIHLHPEWQIVFAEIIVLLQKEFDMHILLTTHSPYFLQAIQIFSEKYDIENKTEYYVSEVNSEGFSRFINTTKDVGKIYTLLAKPFELLNSIESEMKESRGH